MDILVCPIDRHRPLDLIEFNARDQLVVDGAILCSECGRYYPIIDEIPVMLPDKYRNAREDLEFLQKWRDRLPEQVVKEGKPWSLDHPAPEEATKP
jgi:uncharacterized protein YbaR (Trm112 family)